MRWLLLARGGGANFGLNKRFRGLGGLRWSAATARYMAGPPARLLSGLEPRSRPALRAGRSIRTPRYHRSPAGLFGGPPEAPGGSRPRENSAAAVPRKAGTGPASAK